MLRSTVTAERPVHRIVLVRALYLGDFLLAVPAFRAFRRTFPAAEITLIGLPWAASLAARFDTYLDRFLPFPGFPGFEEVEYEPRRTEAFLQRERARDYDLAVQMHGSGRCSNGFTAALGGHTTVGFYPDQPTPDLTIGAPYPDGEPEVLRNLRLAHMAGCGAFNPELEFPLTAQDHQEACSLLSGMENNRPLVVLHPGSKRPTRRWPAEYFAALADAVRGRYRAEIVITGNVDERPTAQAVLQHMRGTALNLAGRTSLGGLAAVLNRANLVVSNDTGPAHLSEAVATPTITVYGPGDHARWAPLDPQRYPTVRQPVHCSPCLHWECPIDHRCLRRIPPERVAEMAGDLLMHGRAA